MLSMACLHSGVQVIPTRLEMLAAAEKFPPRFGENRLKRSRRSRRSRFISRSQVEAQLRSSSTEEQLSPLDV